MMFFLLIAVFYMFFSWCLMVSSGLDSRFDTRNGAARFFWSQSTRSCLRSQEKYRVFPKNFPRRPKA